MSIQADPETRTSVSPGVLAKQTLDKAVSYLLSGQKDPGYWVAELETNVTMDAEDLLLREFLGIRDDNQTKMAAAWIRSKQSDDGTWANAHAVPADLSTTIEAYVALKLAGDDIEMPHMRRAREAVLSHGGAARSNVFTRITGGEFACVL